MTPMPSVSVVMSVYNGASQLRATLDSIAAQTFTDYELIVVDDGSADATAEILAEYLARDARIRVVRQENAGLTRALIAGCGVATAPVIARHDCGDRSHPERLRRSFELLTGDTVLVACETKFFAPGGEELGTTEHHRRDVRESLLHSNDPAGLPHHGAAMFRTDAYRRAGGYRAEFYFAQDLDLWLRLAKLGDIAIVPEPLYEARIDVHTISSTHRPEQVALTRIALQLRATTNDEETARLLAEAARIRPSRKPRRRSARGEARALYFIGSWLRKSGNPRWKSYISAAVRRNPLHAAAWLKLLLYGRQR